MENKNYDKETEKVTNDIQELINKCWEENKVMGREYRNKLFPNGKPAVDEFLNTLVANYENDRYKNEKISIKNILKKNFFIY